MSSSGRLARALDQVLDPLVLRLVALVAVLGAITSFVVPLTPLAEFTASWGVAAVGLLALAASLFSAAAATSSASTSERAAEASLRSADVAERAETAGVVASQAAQRSAEAADNSVRAAHRAHQLQLYELARAAHLDLTSGPVAEARGRLGALSRAQYDHERSVAPGTADPTLEATSRARRGNGEEVRQARNDWFTLLWCFQRLRAVDDVLAADHPEAAAAPQAYLWRLVGPQLAFLNREATYTRAALEEVLGEFVDDHDAKADLVWLVQTIPAAHSAAEPRPGGQSASASDVVWRPRPDNDPQTADEVGAWADTITSTDPATRQTIFDQPAVAEVIAVRNRERNEADARAANSA